MNLNYHFGEALKGFMHKNKIEHTWLAKQIDVHSQAIHQLYRTANPRKDKVEKILTALNITIDQLYSHQIKDFSEPKIDYITKPKPTIEINIEEYEYLIKALRERDELKNKEIERLEKANRAQPETY